jgi:hypothetical protein
MLCFCCPGYVVVKGEDFMRMGNHLVRRGLVTAVQMLQALDQQMKGRLPIGQLAVQTGHLTILGFSLPQAAGLLAERSPIPLRIAKSLPDSLG